MDKRTITAFVLSFLVLFGFQYYMVKTAPPPRPPTKPPAEGFQPAAPTGTAGGDVAVAPAPTLQARGRGGLPERSAPESSGAGEAERPEVAVEPVAAPEPPSWTGTLSNARLAARFRAEGGALESVTLTGYFGDDRKTSLELLNPFVEPTPALLMAIPQSDVDLRAVRFAVEERADRTLVFRRSLGGGLLLEKEVRLAEEGFHFDILVRISNTGHVPRTIDYALFGAGGIALDDPAGRSPSFAVAGLLSDPGSLGVTPKVELKTQNASDVPLPGADKPLEFAGNTSFGGNASKYFAAVLVPVEASRPLLLLEQTKGRLHGARDPEPSVRASYRQKNLRIEPGKMVEHRYLFFAGPKQDDVLEKYKAYGLPRLLDFSSFVPGSESLSIVFLAILRAFSRIGQSYGLAIILLTFLVRLALHPLSRASQRSMFKMQKLAPAVNKIREKYKGKTSKEAMQKQNLEIMELYKRHGASPIAGCLPMLLQLPVFIGLYNALAYSIELRQSKFLFIPDLSLPDRLFSFGFDIWYLGRFFNLLPVLMVLTMIAQQKMQPPPPDPQQQQQQRIMTLLLPLFGLLFYHVPSGLVLYFFTSSLLGILETRLVRHQLQREEAAGKFKF